MKLREITIQNFRCFSDITVPISDNTILVGENNSGKTAFLDALKSALPLTVAARRRTFDEYDYHMISADDSPQTSQGIVIELWFREDSTEEWPEPLIIALNEIIQTDPVMVLNSIGLRVSSKYDEDLNEIITKWEFLSIDGEPLGGRGANPANLNKFLSYFRLYYLSSLRDSAREFSPRSQFWGTILRDLKITEEQRHLIGGELARLNEILLAEDPRLEEVRQALERGQEILRIDGDQRTTIQALPLQPWDLMSKAQVIIKARGRDISFPLDRHGHGTQSLAVLFLFQAYIDVLLKPTFEEETKAMLALEEPEAHLHPQAIRALAGNIDEIESQKIVSTHSPYFIQEIPFEQIRMFRREEDSSKVVYLKRSFFANIPENPGIIQFCGNNADKYSFHARTSVLTVKGKIEEDEYRRLLRIYAEQNEFHSVLKKLKDESQLYLDESDLQDLGTYVKRIRGDILFASAWLLCEGQSEYLLLRYFAELIGQPLDQTGIAIVDFQNNGSPGAFIGLAQTFEIPWLMFFDDDDAGRGFLNQVKNRGFTDDQIETLVRPLPGDEMDLEKFLALNGFINEYIEILNDNNVQIATNPGESGFEEEIIQNIKLNKVGNVSALIEKLREGEADGSRVPGFFREIIEDLIEMVN